MIPIFIARKRLKEFDSKRDAMLLIKDDLVLQFQQSPSEDKWQEVQAVFNLIEDLDNQVSFYSRQIPSKRALVY